MPTSYPIRAVPHWDWPSLTSVRRCGQSHWRGERTRRPDRGAGNGVVQGVGFRPFVYGLATSLGLAGLVGNDVDGVFAEIEGAAEAVAKFLLLLEQQAPPLARIERVTTASLRPAGSAGFAIVPSQAGGQRHALVSADSATCDDCLRELADPADRRYRLPVHQLHQLRAAVHDRAGRPLRPAAHDDERLRDVRRVRGRVPRPGRPPVPRPARLLSGVRTAAQARASRRDRTVR